MISIRLAVALLAAAAAFGAGWALRDIGAERDAANVALKHSEALKQAAKNAVTAEREARAEQDRQAKALETIANEERQAQAARAAAADRARAAAAGLRAAARAATDALVSEAAARASAAERGEATAGAGLVLADRIENVLGSCGARTAELAVLLDDARARGLACQRAYAEVTGNP